MPWLLPRLGVAVDRVEQFEGEIIHAGTKLADLRGKNVVGDNRWNGSDQSGGSRDESFGDSRSDSAQRGCTSGAESVECVDDSPDGSEETDERSDGSSGGQPRKSR